MAMYLGDKPIKVIERGSKNLLNIFGRTKGVGVEWSNSLARVLDDKQYYVGLMRNNYCGSRAGLSVSFVKNGIIVTGGGQGYGVAFPVKCKPNTAYTVSFEGTVNAECGCGYYAEDGTFLGNTSGYSKNSWTFTTPENCVVFTVVFVADGEPYTNIMLNKGDTALPYEPYNLSLTTPIKKRTGKNLFDISKANVTMDGDYFCSNVGHTKSFYNLRVTAGKTYTVSYTVKTLATEGVGSKIVISVMEGEDKGYGAGYLYVRTLENLKEYSRVFQFTVPNNVTWVSFNTLSVHTFKDFMLNEGDTALPYEPYAEWYEY